MLKKIYNLYFLIPFIFMPFLYKGFGVYNYIVYYSPREKFTLILALLSLIAIFLIPKRKKNILDIMLFIFIIIFIIGQIYTPDKYYGSRTIIGFFMFIIIYKYFSLLKIERTKIFKGIFWIGVIESIIGFMQKNGVYYKYINVKKLDGRADIIGTIGHVNQYSHFITLIFLMGLALLFLTISKRNKIILIIGELTIFYAILLTGTRASLLSIAIAGIILIYYLRKRIFKKNRNYFIILIIGIIIEILLTNGVLTQRIKNVTKLDKGSTYARLNLYKKSLMMISEEPIIGYGTGSYYKEELNYYDRLENYLKNNKNIKSSEKKELEDFYYVAGHTHNEFLQIYVENGIFGFLLMIFIAIYIIYDFVIDYRIQKIITFLPLLAVVIISNFSFPLHMVHNLVLTGIMLGINRIEMKKDIKLSNHKLIITDTDKTKINI